jgi:hypothetical protein
MRPPCQRPLGRLYACLRPAALPTAGTIGFGLGSPDYEPLSNLDWARALAITEICWASDLLGAIGRVALAHPRKADVEARSSPMV